LNLTLRNLTGVGTLGDRSQVSLTIHKPSATYANVNRVLAQAYLELLHRPIDPSGAANWTAALATRPVGDVIRMIENSDEFRTTTVGGIYQRLLGRSPDQGPLSSFVTELRQGSMNIPQVQAVVAGSAEYFQNR